MIPVERWRNGVRLSALPWLLVELAEEWWEGQKEPSVPAPIPNGILLCEGNAPPSPYYVTGTKGHCYHQLIVPIPVLGFPLAEIFRAYGQPLIEKAEADDCQALVNLQMVINADRECLPRHVHILLRATPAYLKVGPDA